MIRFQTQSKWHFLPLIIFWSLIACNRNIEKKQAEAHHASVGIALSEAQRQLANIQVAPVVLGTIGHPLLLSGTLKVDEQSTTTVSAGIAGRIQKLYFKNTGDLVNAGDALYEFYSDDLLAMEREYIALENNNWNASGHFDQSLALENKLALVGMLPAQIKEIQRNRKFSTIMTIYSKTRGIIRSINITEGQYVSIGQKLMVLADDQKLWVEAQVYPNELQLLKKEMPVGVIIPAAGDQHLQSRITFINPAFEPGRNVMLVRAVIDNPQKKFYPGMLALLSVQTQKSAGMIIPVSALLIEKEGTKVWIQNEDGSFSSKLVTTGVQTADSILILSGLKTSDKIVTSGAYLLNSEQTFKKSNGITEKEAL